MPGTMSGGGDRRGGRGHKERWGVRNREAEWEEEEEGGRGGRKRRREEEEEGGRGGRKRRREEERAVAELLKNDCCRTGRERKRCGHLMGEGSRGLGGEVLEEEVG